MKFQLSYHSIITIFIAALFLLSPVTPKQSDDRLHFLFPVIPADFLDNQGNAGDEFSQTVKVNLAVRCNKNSGEIEETITIPAGYKYSGNGKKCETITNVQQNPIGRDVRKQCSCEKSGQNKVIVKVWWEEHPDCKTWRPASRKEEPKSFFRGTIVIKAKKVESQQ